jgi:hypothetical protein
MKNQRFEARRVHVVVVVSRPKREQEGCDFLGEVSGNRKQTNECLSTLALCLSSKKRGSHLALIHSL